MTQRAELMEQIMDFLRKTALVTEVNRKPILTGKGEVVLTELESSSRVMSSSNVVSSSFDSSDQFEGGN
jgi:hypothetical protein